MAIGRLGLRRGNGAPASRSNAFILAALLLVLPSIWLFAPRAAAQTEAPQPQPQQPPPPQPQPEPQPKAQPQPPPAPIKGEAPATVLDDKEVDTLLGKEIRSASGENMGRIVDVLVNRAGQVRAAIIDFGGFLGVGTRKIAVAWQAIQFAPDGKLDRITLTMTRDELRLAPEYKKGEPVVVLGPNTHPPAEAPKPPPAPAPPPPTPATPPAAPPTTPPPTTEAAPAPAPPPH